ncbi:MAG: DHH family phosphoesterase [Spirochaetales bacterium]|nr:DHH family phosphoesterase [Spirochaetales bacterium]
MNETGKYPSDSLHTFFLFCDKLFVKKKSLLVILHDNPDPDSIASAWAMQYLVFQRYAVSVSIAYGGVIRRAENRAMIQKLKIKLKQIGRIKFQKYDCISLVDTQPGAGNNSLPDNASCDIVIDHHPQRNSLRADFALIKPDTGATATLMVNLLQYAGLDIRTDLATALSYAITSETQNLKREANRQDIEAFLFVYNKCNVRTLGEIIHPKLPRTYFITLSTALKKAIVFQNIICTHLGEVPNPEIVSEMADFFHRHERIGRVLCTGKFRDYFIVSIRVSSAGAHAGKIIQKLVKNTDTAGGHETMAGGYIPLQKSGAQDITVIENDISKNFAKILGYINPRWNQLIPQL